MPSKLKLIENRLNPENTFLVNGMLSHADFVIFEFLYDYFLRPLKAHSMRQLLEKSSLRLLEFSEKFLKNDPKLLEYITNREEKPF